MARTQRKSPPIVGVDLSAVKMLLIRPIAFHPILARLCGSLTAGLMLSQAIYWTDRTSDEDGWFYKTQPEWESEITITRFEQEGARKHLRKFDFWMEKKQGVPALLYYKVDVERLALAISQFAENQQPSLRETDVQDCGKLAPQDAENQQPLQGTETTTETTTDKPLTSKEVEGEDPQLSLKSRIRNFIQKVQLSKTKMKSAWNGAEGKILAQVVKENPSWTEADWQRMLKNWSQSDPALVRFGDRASKWLPNISRFATGPLVRLSSPRASPAASSAPWGRDAKAVIAEMYAKDVEG